MTNVLSPNATKIMKLKYSREKEDGELEEWNEVVTRVARYVASAEETEANELAVMGKFIKMMYQRDFIPGGRVLANAGTEIKNLFNCFVLPVQDSRESIYENLKKAAEIFAWGGGIGYNFSNLRAEGSLVKTTGGEASGPLSFMRLFDQTGEVISQASRRGAQMGIINIDHPDVYEFINFKNRLNPINYRIYKEYIKNAEAKGLDVSHDVADVLRKTLADNQLTHFNISVGITNEFMVAVEDNEAWLEYVADELLEVIAKNAWKNGDPGIYFIDRANEDNLVPYLGRLEATNPCGEVPLLPHEPCCLGSINLYNMVEDKRIDWLYLESVIRMAVRFLDNIHTINETPVKEINDMAKSTRRLGLGVMGLADMLAEMEIPYDSKEAFDLVTDLSFFIGKTAWKCSMELAEERGPFPAYDEDKINWNLIDKFDLERKPVRNVAVTSIAPTGSIALIADVNNGIEPFFSKKYVRNITEGVGNSAKDTMEQTSNGFDVKTSHDISWQNHIEMQARWQEFIDNAVSKTINMPNDASFKDIKQAYMLAWKKGLKGITVYRDGSKLFQILERN